MQGKTFCRILNISLRDLSQTYKEVLSSILLVFREDKKFVVNSKTRLQKNDVVYF